MIYYVYNRFKPEDVPKRFLMKNCFTNTGTKKMSVINFSINLDIKKTVINLTL